MKERGGERGGGEGSEREKGERQSEIDTYTHRERERESARERETEQRGVGVWVGVGVQTSRMGSRFSSRSLTFAIVLMKSAESFEPCVFFTSAFSRSMAASSAARSLRHSSSVICTTNITPLPRIMLPGLSPCPAHEYPKTTKGTGEGRGVRTIGAYPLCKMYYRFQIADRINAVVDMDNLVVVKGTDKVVVPASVPAVAVQGSAVAS